jgi:hypothetical protein
MGSSMSKIAASPAKVSELTQPRSRHSVIYLACPYTHPDPEIRRRRFEAATKAAAELIRQGNIVYSPITMTHPIDMELAGRANTLGSDYWVAFDEAFMEMCSEIVILQLDGWQESSGIARELDYFRSAGKPIRYMSV